MRMHQHFWNIYCKMLIKYVIVPRKENTADGSFEPTRMLLPIIRPYLFEFVFLGSGGSLFLRIVTH